MIDLGGKESREGGLLLQAHMDTLGAMVAEVKANGRLRVTNLGGMRAENGETESPEMDGGIFFAEFKKGLTNRDPLL